MLCCFSKKTLLLLLFVLTDLGSLKAAQIFIEGFVVDSLTGKGIPNVQVYNETKRESSFTLNSGYFKISGSLKDTLAIVALGYYGKAWIPALNNFRDGQKIYLTRRIYEIDPITINILPENYNKFKKAFLEVKPDQGLIIEGLPSPVPKMVPDLLDTNVLKKVFIADNGAAAIPLTYIYNLYSKEEKSKRKVLYLKQEQKEQVSIDQKFNKELINKVTGLDGEEITSFIDFCNFSHRFLYESSDYEIVEAVHTKFEEYQATMSKTP
jgi:hypothetical protein